MEFLDRLPQGAYRMRAYRLEVTTKFHIYYIVVSSGVEGIGSIKLNKKRPRGRRLFEVVAHRGIEPLLHG